MKRRDFLKGVVGGITVLGAGKVLGASEPESIIEVDLPTKPIHESSMIEDYRQFEVPINYTFDKATAELLSRNQQVVETVRLVLAQLQVDA